MNRDLDVGGTINDIFSVYRDQAGVLLPIAAGLFLLQTVIAVLLAAALGVVGLLFALVVQIILSTLYAGMVVELVRDVQDGRRDHSVGELVNAVTGVVGRLILAGLAVGVLVAIGFVLLIVPGLFLLTIFAVVAPVIVLERKGVGDALGRSRELVKGNGWQVFGIIVVVFLIVIVASMIVGAIGAAAGDVGRFVGNFVGSTLTAPVWALAAATIYFGLRGARGEGEVAADATSSASPATAGTTAPSATPPAESTPGTGATEPQPPSGGERDNRSAEQAFGDRPPGDRPPGA